MYPHCSDCSESMEKHIRLRLGHHRESMIWIDCHQMNLVQDVCVSIARQAVINPRIHSRFGQLGISLVVIDLAMG
jgi:hypothetical protein